MLFAVHHSTAADRKWW